MKVLVTTKKVPDPYSRLSLKADGTGIQDSHVKWVMNPFDEIALECAIQLKEKNLVEEIILMTIGPEHCQDILRHGLALGADRALLLTHNTPVEPLFVAKAAAKVVQEQNITFCIMGKQAIDDDCNQVGQMLAALLGWPQATFISSLSIDNQIATVARETDAGLETMILPLPAVFTADLRLNTPRYASLPNIMKARQKPLEIAPLSTLGIDSTPRLISKGLSTPPKREPGKILDNVDALMRALKDAQLL